MKTVKNKHNRLNECLTYLKRIRSIKIQKDIVDKMEMNKSTVSQALKGNERYLTDSFLEKFANTFNLNPQYLIEGEGEMLKSLTTSSPKMHPTTKQQGKPLIPIDAVAGYGTDTAGVRYEDCEHYLVPEFDKKGVDFFIRVSGSSMYPKYSNGDILACKKIAEITFFQWGKVYVIDSSQGQLVKRLFEDEDNPENIICVSDNKENYPPFKMPKEEIRSLSIVLDVVRME